MGSLLQEDPRRPPEPNPQTQCAQMNYTWGGFDENGACNPFPNKYSEPWTPQFPSFLLWLRRWASAHPGSWTCLLNLKTSVAPILRHLVPTSARYSYLLSKLLSTVLLVLPWNGHRHRISHIFAPASCNEQLREQSCVIYFTCMCFDWSDNYKAVSCLLSCWRLCRCSCACYGL